MLCYFPHWAVGKYLAGVWAGGARSRLPAVWLALPLLAAAALLARESAARRARGMTPPPPRW